MERSGYRAIFSLNFVLVARSLEHVFFATAAEPWGGERKTGHKRGNVIITLGMG
jgi:hypothetical protein